MFNKNNNWICDNKKKFKYRVVFDPYIRCDKSLRSILYQEEQYLFNKGLLCYTELQEIYNVFNKIIDFPKIIHKDDSTLLVLNNVSCSMYAYISSIDYIKYLLYCCDIEEIYELKICSMCDRYTNKLCYPKNSLIWEEYNVCIECYIAAKNTYKENHIYISPVLNGFLICNEICGKELVLYKYNIINYKCTYKIILLLNYITFGCNLNEDIFVIVIQQIISLHLL